MAQNAFEKLRDEIENGIVTGEFPRGERLDETQLAQRYGVSRTPIREALMQLSAIGLVETRPRRGTIVAEPTAERLFEMFEVMAELEAMATALAARRLTDEDRTDVLAAHARCGEAVRTGDTDSYYYENEDFHRVLFASSHNTFLAEQCCALQRRLRPYRRLQLRVRNRMNASYEEHGHIVDAILAGDPEQAGKNMRAHISVQGDRFSDLIAVLADAQRRASRSASDLSP